MKKQLVIALLAFSIGAQAQNMDWVSTTQSESWKIEKKVLSKKQEGSYTKVDVFTDKTLQQMNGFGGCFNELGWEAIKLLSPIEQEKLCKELFSPEGANFCYNRFPMGASDYASSFYSFNETVDDFKMTNFSIARDKNCLIPYIKEAQRYNPDMRFFASPWCPPSWMKTNGHYASRSSEKYNNLPQEQQSLPHTTGFKMLSGYLEAYALYFSKFLDAYKAEGIDVKDIHVQNEVVAEQIFPSCIWEPQDIALFIAEYLGPRFQSEKRDVNIWLSTLNIGDPEYVRTAMKNKKAVTYIKGLGFQWDGKNGIGTIHKEFPELRLMQTENECGGGENNWNSALYTWSLMKQYLKNGAEAYIYWNFVLQTPGISNWGWVQNSMVTIHAESKTVVYNPEYYLMKHFSHFVQRGAYRLQTQGIDDVLAFKNVDGSIVIVAVNTQDHEQNILLNVAEKEMKVTLKANSLNTFRLKS